MADSDQANGSLKADEQPACDRFSETRAVRSILVPKQPSSEVSFMSLTCKEKGQETNRKWSTSFMYK